MFGSDTSQSAPTQGGSAFGGSQQGAPSGGATGQLGGSPGGSATMTAGAGGAGAGGGGAGGGGAGGGEGGGGGGGAAGGGAGGNSNAAAQVFSHFADEHGGKGTAKGGPGGGGGGGGPATLAEAVSQSNSKPTPKVPAAPATAELQNHVGASGVQADGQPEGQAAGQTAGQTAGQADASQGKKEQKSELPHDIVAAFPDANLSGVAVYLNSAEAAAKKVDGFANSDEIHVAPGADVQSTLRHEAAHVVQFRSGKKQLGDGPAVDSKEHNEEAARKAEQGGTHKASDLGTAAPGEVRFKDESSPSPKSTNLSEKGVPKVVFNGTEFKSVSGEFSNTLSKADWGKMSLFEKEVWWRIPAFPAAGLYVKASAVFSPSAKISWSGSYSYSQGAGGAPGKFQIGASLDGELSAAITGALEGGAGLNLVVQRGGVGLEAALTAKAYAKMNKHISFWIDTAGHVGLDLVPFEIDFGAVVKGALNAVVWTEGWFADERKTWTLADMTIATLAQYKADIGLSFNSKDGVKPTIGGVKGGTFTWGEAPALQ